MDPHLENIVKPIVELLRFHIKSVNVQSTTISIKFESTNNSDYVQVPKSLKRLFKLLYYTMKIRGYKTIGKNQFYDEWMIFFKKIICDADAIKSLCAFQLLFYSVEMLYHMIRDDKIKLCDKNILKHDNKVLLITCDSYNESEVSVIIIIIIILQLQYMQSKTMTSV